MILVMFNIESHLFFEPKYKEETPDLACSISSGVIVGDADLEELIERSNRENVRVTARVAGETTLTLWLPKHELTPLNDAHSKYWEQ